MIFYSTRAYDELVAMQFQLSHSPISNGSLVDGDFIKVKWFAMRLGPPSCRKFSVSEKYKMLEGVGGRNQLYMAETPDEASRGFVQSSPSPLFKAKSFLDNVDE
ncbi:hypothetical protein TELCIR_12381, partial [Teladorsagia circumcincta]